jgi:hypothetical protein
MDAIKELPKMAGAEPEISLGSKLAEVRREYIEGRKDWRAMPLRGT